MISPALPFALLALQSVVAAAEIPSDVVSEVRRAAPAVTITSAELKEREGRRYYDVAGVLPDGAEMELDLLQSGDRWSVVEIQKDIPWLSTPAAVRTAARSSWRGADPVRVIESRQAQTGEVIYELFSPQDARTPALEVMLKDGTASVLKETWPH